MTEPQPTSTAAERCTSLLLAAFMDHMKLSDILRCMAVNQSWREHAVNHPTYYGDLQMLQGYPAGYEEFILLRLSRSAGRPVSVNLELGDPNPPRLLEEIANHLAHIRSLTVRQSSEQHFEPFLAMLCRPAPILRVLQLDYQPKMWAVGQPLPAMHLPTLQPATVLPADFLAGQAPALDEVGLCDIELPSEFPPCFSNIKSLSFSSMGRSHGDRRDVIFPNPFTQCERLRVLRLSGDIALDPAVSLARSAWERLAILSFSGGSVADNWHALRLPLANVRLFGVDGSDAAGALALADTLPGALELALQPPTRIPLPFGLDFGVTDFILYNASLRAAANPRITRTLSGQLSERGAAAAFGMPALTDRVARLVIPLGAWDDFVGFSAFGPFRAVDELVLTIMPAPLALVPGHAAHGRGPGDAVHGHGPGDAVPLEVAREQHYHALEDAQLRYWHTPPSSALSCPRVKRLVLTGRPAAPEQSPVDIGRVAAFARAALSDAAFPLELEYGHMTVSGSCDECPETFSSCSRVDRKLMHDSLHEQFVI